MVGQKLRALRQAQSLSLQQVAEKARISAATLSRIENDKQALDVTLMLSLSKILKCRASELVDDGEPRDEREALVKKLASLDSKTRATIWTDLAAQAKARRAATRNKVRTMAAEVEELLAQIDFIRSELESVRRRIK